MTTETETREATQAQYNVLRNYSRRIFLDEWYVTDTYQGDLLTFDEAGRRANREYQKALNARRETRPVTPKGRPPNPRATSARAAVIANTPSGEWEARLHRQALDSLFGLLPPTTSDPFTAEQKARWLAYATLTLDVVWPNE